MVAKPVQCLKRSQTEIFLQNILIRSRQIQDFTKSKGSENVYPFCTRVKCFIVSSQFTHHVYIFLLRGILMTYRLSAAFQVLNEERIIQFVIPCSSPAEPEYFLGKVPPA